MPRVHSLTVEKRIEDTIYGAIYASMGLHNFKQKDISKLLGLKGSTVSIHFKNKSFSLQQIIEILNFCELEIKVCDKC